MTHKKTPKKQKTPTTAKITQLTQDFPTLAYMQLFVTICRKNYVYKNPPTYMIKDSQFSSLLSDAPMASCLSPASTTVFFPPTWQVKNNHLQVTTFGCLGIYKTQDLEIFHNA